MTRSPAVHAALGAAILVLSTASCASESDPAGPLGPGSGAAAGSGGSGGSGQAGTAGSGGAGGATGGAGGVGTGGTSAGTGGTSGTGGASGAGTGGTSAAGVGGVAGTGGVAGSVASGGDAGTSGSGAGGTNAAGAGGSGGAPQGGTGGTAGASAGATGMAGAGGVASEHFSFFVTSLAAVRRESGSMDGFGGDLGGLTGADEICTRIAESSMPGAGAKGWRAFLSTSTENAISRIGTGPWYDRVGRLVAMDVEGLLQERPDGDDVIVNDLPNELGQPNRSGTGTGMDDNHDTITGSDENGEWDGGPTCNDWTSATGSDGPRVGHSWPAGSGMNWIRAHTAPGCVPSVQLVQMGGGSGDGIGNGGGYGGFYCFGLMP